MAYTRGKKILMLCFSWPPLFFGVGMYRGLQFARYLSKLGWKPTVVVSNSGEPLSYCPEEDGKIEGVRVIKVSYNDRLASFRSKRIVKELLAIPDENIAWYKPALKEAEKLLKEEEFDAVFSTSPPETAHLIAKAIKIKYNIPWLADLRDPWAYSHYFKRSRMKNFILKMMEKNTLRYADAIVVVTEAWRATLARLYPDLKNKIFSITNSFDEENLKVDTGQDDRRFIMTYTGKLHKEYQDPEPFLRALKKVLEKRILEPSRVKARFYTYGYYSPDLLGMITRYNLRDVVEVSGYIPHKESISKQLESTVLLFIDWRQPSSEVYSDIVSTYKIYEYLGARRPIVGISATGNIATNILKASGAAKLATDEFELEKILTEWFIEFRNKGRLEYGGNEEFIKKYNAESTTKELANLLEHISKQKL
ncbi:MAG: glycosyltransferase [Armatimonadota bacterium]